MPMEYPVPDPLDVEQIFNASFDNRPKQTEQDRTVSLANLEKKKVTVTSYVKWNR